MNLIYNPVWKEYNVSNLYHDKDLKFKLSADTYIVRLDQLACVHKTKVSSNIDLLASPDSEIWTITGFPENIYGKKDDIDRLYQEIRRSLLGIVACEDLKPSGDAIAKMIAPDGNSIAQMSALV